MQQATQVITDAVYVGTFYSFSRMKGYTLLLYSLSLFTLFCSVLGCLRIFFFFFRKVELNGTWRLTLSVLFLLIPLAGCSLQLCQNKLTILNAEGAWVTLWWAAPYCPSPIVSQTHSHTQLVFTGSWSCLLEQVFGRETHLFDCRDIFNLFMLKHRSLLKIYFFVYFCIFPGCIMTNLINGGHMHADRNIRLTSELTLQDGGLE